MALGDEFHIRNAEIRAAEEALRALDPDEGNWPTGEQVDAILDAAARARAEMNA